MAVNQERLNATINATLSGISRPVELGRRSSQALLADVTKQLKALSGARGLHDVTLMRGSLVQPGSRQTAIYLRSLQEIARELQERWESIVQAHFSDPLQRNAVLADPLNGFAPAGSGGVVAGVRSIRATPDSSVDRARRA